MTTAAATRVRSRSRALDMGTVPQKPQPTPEMVRLAQESYLARKEEYAQKKVADAKAKDLEKLMVPAKVTDFVVTAGEATVDVVYGTNPTEYVAVDVLQGLVDKDTFLRIVEATKGNVEKFAGKSVLIQCVRTGQSEPKVRIKQRKK
jgi:hypothetical protein